MTQYKTVFKQDLTKEYTYILGFIRKQIESIENDVPIRRDSDWQKAREGILRELEWLMSGLTHTTEVVEREIAHSIDERLRQTLTPDFIAEVAYIYSQAKLAGTHPTRFVMEHFKISRITASRWVRKAVDLKMLPEPEGQGKSSKPNVKLVRATTIQVREQELA